MDAVVERIGALRSAIGEVVVGQANVVDEVLATLLAGGHVLLEGVPGLAKTLLARTLASALGLDFKRIQFTPDLMPADVVGTNIFDMAQGRFHLVRGPVFTQILLADEVNRTPPKTQAALLEAMEERQVTLDGNTLPLPDPFFVIATQNPLDHEGTYPLPEAQLDRFTMKVRVEYPSAAEEAQVYRRFLAGTRVALPTPVIDLATLTGLRDAVGAVHVDDKVLAYALAVVSATRGARQLQSGASPRAGLMWLQVARAWAAMEGRAFVIPDDLKRMALPVLRHRLRLGADAELEGTGADGILSALIDRVDVPR